MTTSRRHFLGMAAATPLAMTGALALGAVAPLAALIPLIETGPGENANCRQVLGAAGTRK